MKVAIHTKESKNQAFMATGGASKTLRNEKRVNRRSSDHAERQLSDDREPRSARSIQAERRDPTSLFVVRSWETDSNASLLNISFGIDSMPSQSEQGCDPFRDFPDLCFGQAVNVKEEAKVKEGPCRYPNATLTKPISNHPAVTKDRSPALNPTKAKKLPVKKRKKKSRLKLQTETPVEKLVATTADKEDISDISRRSATKSNKLDLSIQNSREQTSDSSVLSGKREKKPKKKRRNVFGFARRSHKNKDKTVNSSRDIASSIKGKEVAVVQLNTPATSGVKVSGAPSSDPPTESEKATSHGNGESLSGAGETEASIFPNSGGKHVEELEGSLNILNIISSAGVEQDAEKDTIQSRQINELKIDSSSPKTADHGVEISLSSVVDSSPECRETTSDNGCDSSRTGDKDITPSKSLDQGTELSVSSYIDRSLGSFVGQSLEGQQKCIGRSLGCEEVAIEEICGSNGTGENRNKLDKCEGSEQEAKDAGMVATLESARSTNQIAVSGPKRGKVHVVAKSLKQPVEVKPISFHRKIRTPKARSTVVDAKKEKVPVKMIKSLARPVHAKPVSFRKEKESTSSLAEASETSRVIVNAQTATQNNEKAIVRPTKSFVKPVQLKPISVRQTRRSLSASALAMVNRNKDKILFKMMKSLGTPVQAKPKSLVRVSNKASASKLNVDSPSLAMTSSTDVDVNALEGVSDSKAVTTNQALAEESHHKAEGKTIGVVSNSFVPFSPLTTHFRHFIMERNE